MSRRPGIGSNYLDTHTDWHVKGRRNYTQVNGIIGRIPRFYKDKLFSAPLREALANESIDLADDQYNKEIERLSLVHSDPSYYYDEAIRHAHDSVYSKLNDQDLF